MRAVRKEPPFSMGGIMRKKHTIEGKTASEISNVIEEHIVGNMAYRNREIMKDRFIDGYPYEMLAEKYELSTQQVKGLCYRLLNEIAPYIK